MARKTHMASHRDLHGSLARRFSRPEARGNKTKEIIYSLLNLSVISFVLFPQASEPV